MGQERAAEEQSGAAGPERGAGDDPPSGRTAQAAAGELPGRGAGDGAGEGEAAQALAGGAQQGAAAVDRGEQHVAHVGLLDRQRSAAAARAQAGGHGEHGGEAQPAGTVAVDVGRGRGADRGVLDEAGDEEEGAAAEECGEVRAVQRVEPLQLTQTVATSGAAHRPQGVEAGGVVDHLDGSGRLVVLAAVHAGSDAIREPDRHGRRPVGRASTLSACRAPRRAPFLTRLSPA